MKTLWKYAALLAVALTLISCEKEKGGLVDSTIQTPVLSFANVSPSIVNLDFPASPVVRVGNRYQVHISVSGYAVRQGGPSISRIQYRLSEPGAGLSLSTGSLRMMVSGDTTYFDDSVSVTTDRNGIGMYLININAINSAGLSSGTMQQSFTLTRANSKPRLSNLIIPDTLRIPAHGVNLYTISVAAADSDGYTDLASVGFRVSPSFGSLTSMYDDGNTRYHADPLHVSADGDLIQGDGVFSVIVRLDSTNTVGPRTLLFQATDRSGAISDSLLHRINIVR